MENHRIQFRHIVCREESRLDVFEIPRCVRWVRLLHLRKPIQRGTTTGMSVTEFSLSLSVSLSPPPFFLHLSSLCLALLHSFAPSPFSTLSSSMFLFLNISLYFLLFSILIYYFCLAFFHRISLSFLSVFLFSILSLCVCVCVCWCVWGEVCVLRSKPL